jgi:uncharacterized SAM-binding protein YcdF (DUF218 family)
MFYYLSKIFWLFAEPINLIALLLILALAATFAGWRRAGTGITALALAILLVATWTTFGALLLRPLEDRFARPDPAPAEVAGIILLGGGFEGAVNLARGGYELNDSGDRMVEAAVLARRYPDAKVIVSGGTGSLLFEGEADADTAQRLLTALGVAPERLVLEKRSRNTYENAIFTGDLVRPQPGQKWLLVTSAFHMPRSMALFRKAGFEVIAWPSDYRTKGTEGIGRAEDSVSDSLENTSLGIREWIGLVAYWATGRIDSPFPAP